MIYDPDEIVYQVPESVLPRPGAKNATSSSNSAIQFSYQEEPFSFAVTRTDTKETLFNTSGSNLIFQSQYLNLRTSLPQNPNLYGLGEHSDSFLLNTTNYTRTLWNRDAFEIPAGTNLYGSHPIYIEQRETGSHGVFLLNSDGMDIKINQTEYGEQYLEYNILGGIFDFYFLAGPSPKEVHRESATINSSSKSPGKIIVWGWIESA
ncbi:hypothetical protein N7532_005343 [Penicillium argentinense]|uniref:Glycoside hydrolase family 31 N-terminal domain-containing protein n=1 Tax=Penicillium argentinense TaxID=1131581 RepID=A0A9W9KAU0_9EURO|nr:uncharacterized protein N7532_005343 [Penicillium argentinense]KAJ5098342.1 hypothetical protein N7532_005343 [Penicillium argentinense]